MNVFLEKKFTDGNLDENKLTDKNGPYINEYEQCYICKLLERKQVRIYVIRYALRKPIQWMKRVARVRRGHDPLMVGFMQSFVDFRMMQAPVDPIDEEIGEQDEERELKEIVQAKRGIRRGLIKFRVAAHFTEEKGRCEDGHDGKRFQSLANFEPNLILKIFRMHERCVVENKDV